MWGVIGRVCVAVWMGCFTVAAAQLPPDVMVDKYLLEAKMLSEEKDHRGALEAMDRIVALQKEHDLTLPEAFPFHYAQTALAAGSVQATIDSANRYLTAAGREGKYYREALELLVKAERRLQEPAADRVGSTPVKPNLEPQPQAVPPSSLQAQKTTKAQPAVDCRKWNTRKYFQKATVEIVTACLASGAVLMARDDGKNTPLHTAVRSTKNPAVIEALLAAGANLEALNENGRTPLQISTKDNENPDVREVLLAAGAGRVESQMAAAKAQRKAPSGGGEGWAALVAGVAGGAIASASGLDAATATELGATIAGSVLADEAVGSSGTGAASGGTSGNTGATAGGGPCQVPGYPNPPGGVSNLGFSWCPASVSLQVRSFALQAAGAECAIATGSSSTPEQIEARRREIRAACDRLSALGQSNCQCPAGLGQ